MSDGQSDGRPSRRIPLRDRLRDLRAGESFREIPVGRADIRPGHRVLDPGCGRGVLAFLVKESQPGAAVTGLDVDERDVARARRCARGKR